MVALIFVVELERMTMCGECVGVWSPEDDIMSHEDGAMSADLIFCCLFT